MTIARSLIVTNEEGTYHCISRCVRRAYLCGQDKVSGKNFDHRKAWVRDRLIFLTRIFAIEVLGYALMSTHSHTMLRTRPDILAKLNDREIATRWLTLFPIRGSISIQEQVDLLVMNQTRITEIRKRLVSISWFMKSLNEFIARIANREDDCTGRFWEGRFKCQRLCGEAAILSCAVYIDLNPIRASVAKTPEESEFTSAYERILALKNRKISAFREPNLWLAPFNDTKHRRGFLSVSLQEYLTLLDSTGRELRRGKSGRIPADLQPILTRIGVNSNYWLDISRSCRHWFSHAIGSRTKLKHLARQMGRSWIKGTSIAAEIFA